jgi:hypothetical protein
VFSAVLRRKIKQSSEIELVLLKCFDVLNNAFPTKFTATRLIMQVIGSVVCLRVSMPRQRCRGAELHKYTPWKKGSGETAIIGKINVGVSSFDG